MIIATTLGARMFPPELQLNNDFSFGGRVGMGFGQRWAVLMDFVASHTRRQSTGIVTSVDALRLLARANLRTGRFRPYAVGGIGGLLFLFNDTPSAAAGAFTAGLGADYRVAPRTFVFLEGSMDVYSQRGITYLSGGRALFTEPDQAKVLGTVSGGVGVEF